MQTASKYSGRPPLPYLAEAKALHELLREGHPGLRYHITRGHAVREVATGQMAPWSYVEAGRWQPARDQQPDGTLTDRRLNPYVLAQHLAGKYDVAWEAPSWSSLMVFDIDCHVPAGLAPGAAAVAHREAVLSRDRMLTRLWEALALGPDKQPVILQTPRGGYHVYLPLLGPGADGGAEGLWPNACLRRHMEAHLATHGLSLEPGRLELYPSGVRLRAPCGRGMLLLAPARPQDPANLGLCVVPGTYRGALARGQELFLEEQADGGLGVRRLQPQFDARRQVAGQVTAFLQAIGQARRPLHVWLGLDKPLWDTTWGPFGRGVPSQGQTTAGERGMWTQHKEDVQGGGGLCPPVSDSKGDGQDAVLAMLPGASVSEDARSVGWLRYGRAFLRCIVGLTEMGLQEPGQRHDAALKLTFYFGAVLGLPRGEVLARLEEWLSAFGHCSATYQRSPRQFVHDTLREAAHYYDHRVTKCARKGPPRRADVALRPLSEADLTAFRAAVAPEAWRAVQAVLAHIKGFADSAGRVGTPVDLSHRTLLLVCGDRRLRTAEGCRRRAYVVALEELARLGVLTLHTNYATGRHARRFSVWYRFGSGALPARDPVTGHRVLARRQVPEGTIVVLAPGDGSQAMRLEPASDERPVVNAATPPPASTVAATPSLALEDDEPASPPASPVPAPRPSPSSEAWWQRMFARRLFTVAELLHADERTVVPGPWTWRRAVHAPRARPAPQVAGPAPPGSCSGPAPPGPAPGARERGGAGPVMPGPRPPPRAGPKPESAERPDTFQDAIDAAWAAFERHRAKHEPTGG